MNLTSFSLSKLIAGLVGLLWCYIEPTLDYIWICAFAIIIDCYTAWRCNRRIYARYREQIKKNPNCKADGKLKSKKMKQMFYDLTVVILCLCLANDLDKKVLFHWGDLHLAQYVAAVFCVIQFVSILENESTCSNATWAKVLQKIVADKTERHFNIKLKELIKEEEEENKNQ